jgi:4-hydroxy-4-methyl-2-oxoglutarate aldolase
MTARSEVDGASGDPVGEQTSGLHTALIADVLDDFGHRRCWLGAEVAPLLPGGKLAGTAFTMRSQAVDELPAQRYVQLLAAFPRMSRGDVLVIATERDRRSGIWGELLSVAARARGVLGAVTDGLVRDVAQITALGFPVFGGGASPLDSAGRQEVVGVQTPIRIGDCEIAPGDLVIGDAMGVVVVPRSIASDVLQLARGRAGSEAGVRDALEAGRDIGEVFDEVGIL